MRSFWTKLPRRASTVLWVACAVGAVALILVGTHHHVDAASVHAVHAVHAETHASAPLAGVVGQSVDEPAASDNLPPTP